MRLKKWYREFETRREFDLEEENVAWIKAHRDFDTQEILPIFMRLGGSRTCSPKADFMEENFGKLPRSALLSPGSSQEPNILLEECSFMNQPQYRSTKGPLTARELYESLQEPRFRVRKIPEAVARQATNATNLGAAGHTTQSAALQTEGNEHQPNAERRVIYIADPTRLSVLALIATASSSQTGPLQNVLYHHFKREAYVGFKITTTGLPMFELAFHLPFWALRRLKAGQKLENSRNVSFLDLEGRESVVMVHSSYSCAVSGVDVWRWITYCLIDTRHDEFNEERECAEGHYTNIESGGLPRLSPCGNAEVIDPGPEPRLFFLRILEVRLEMVRNEWMQIVQWLERSVAQCQEVRYPSHCRLLRVST